MEQHIVDAIVAVLSIFGTGIVTYLTRAIVKFIKQKHLESLAMQAVHYTEDAFKYLSGPGKLKASCEWISKEMKHYHIKIDEARIESAARAAFQIFVRAAEDEGKKELGGQYGEAKNKIDMNHTLLRPTATAAENVITPTAESPLSAMTKDDLRQLVSQVIKEQTQQGVQQSNPQQPSA